MWVASSNLNISWPIGKEGRREKEARRPKDTKLMASTLKAALIKTIKAAETFRLGGKVGKLGSRRIFDRQELRCGAREKHKFFQPKSGSEF